MALIVQKYGGTSVGNTDRIKNVAARVAKYHAQGDKVVVVVSAMSGVTDGLIKLAKDIAPLPSEREMDMLLATGEQQTIALTAIALHTIGIPAVSMTGAQAGIVTDGVHTKAKIHNISPKQVHEKSQGRQCRHCRRFPGRNRCRPNHHARPRRFGFDGDCAGGGAQGRPLPDLHGRGRRLHHRPAHRAEREKTAGNFLRRNARTRQPWRESDASRSVEFAKKFGVVFEVRTSLNENPGTIVKEETKSMEGVVVRGVALDKNQAKVTLVGVPDKPGVAAKIFKALGDATVNVDMIIQNISHGTGTPQTDISFTADKPDLLKAQKVIAGLKKEIGFRDVITAEKIGKLSIVGVGMKSQTGVAGKLFETLAKEGVNIDMISTSEIKISVVIDLAKGEQAVKAVHAAFIG